MKKIVIVDDSATARMIVRRCLEITGLSEAEIHEAGHGKEALALLKEHPADLVISDLNMPVLDGEGLLKWMKASPKLNGIPVIILSSAVNPAKDRALIDLGAYAVISKPISPAKLTDAMGELLPKKESGYGY